VSLAPGPPKPDRRAVLVLLAVTLLGLGWILLPFYGTILWAGILALVFAPVHVWLQQRLHLGRTAAALSTLLLASLVVIFPLVAVAASLASEAAGLYARLQSGESNPVSYLQGVFDALPGWVRSVLRSLGLRDFDTVQRRLTAALAQGSQVIAGQAVGIGQNTFEFLANLCVALYLSFFLIRDGDLIVHALRRAMPLTLAHKHELIGMFGTVVRATVKGNLLVAVIQGVLGGLAFWFLGITGALLWAALMAFLSLLPAVGAAIVWVPVAAYYLLSGDWWQGLSLVAWGVLVIGLVDNLLRPILVGKDVRMPDYVVMITTLGGMAVFGIHGFVIGPTIAAMFMAVWHIHSHAQGAESPLPAGDAATDAVRSPAPVRQGSSER
jgi:predicted PurR-regulated permease PerM